MAEQTVGVIVPVYNAERYLARCLRSIVSQTYPDLEVILWDDGSADGSGAMCDALARTDARVRVVHAPNGGAARARNAAMELCTADRFLFVDADDTLPPEHVATLAAVMDRTGADVVIAGVQYVPGPAVRHAPALWNAEEAIEKLLYRDGVGDYPVSKLFRRSMFDPIRFTEGITSEDFELFYRLFRRAGRVAVTDATTYYYVQRADSVSNGGFNPGFFNRLDICESLIRSVREDYPNILPAAYSRAVDEAIWLYGITPRAFRAERARMRRIIRDCAPTVRADPKVSAKVRRKLLLFTVSPLLWTLRMRCKALLIWASTRLRARETAGAQTLPDGSRERG